ncbi:radical SAM protein [Desulfofundulus salinus]|uniref:radical SAM protein n=1 Tax=Desulfofundulus salinus TaxID=2419843 RepID=UPI001A9BDFEB|nr:radical SAM protein [Desulfofundulus salinum]
MFVTGGGGLPLERLLEEAWQVRRRNFAHRVEFVRPTATRPVSVTGTACALNCAHCGGHFLQGMLPLPRLMERWQKGEELPWSSLLISGGCDPEGVVPVARHLDQLRELAARFKLNLHPGLVDGETARLIGQVASAVSFDLILDEDTIAEVLGLPCGPRDYLRVYRHLRRYNRVFPHLVVGLRGGRLSGEYRVLEALGELGAEALVVIVFFPVPGTAYGGCQPPALEEVARLLATARIMLPWMPIYVGCMRPAGSYRARLDALAVKAGVNRLVLPAPPARELARELGLEVAWRRECCVL